MPSNDAPASLGVGDVVDSAEALRILDDVRRAVEQDPKLAHAAALRLVALLKGSGRAERVIARGGLALWQQRTLDRYLEKRLMKPIRTADLADQVGLSVSHFSRAFKQTYGQPPHARIVLLRLELAKQLMLATEDPLSHIALASGFADQAHFSQSFRRWLGETPRVWRRRNFIGPGEPGSRRQNEATPRNGGEAVCRICGTQGRH